MSEENGTWTIKTSTTLKSMALTFKLDEEFEETTPDGRKVSAIVKQDGNKFISVQTAKDPAQKSTEVVREFLEDKVVQTMKILNSDIVCVQEFKRLP